MKLDLGCGNNKASGYTGVDSIGFPNVDIVLNLCEKKKNKFLSWPWEDNSIEEVNCSHFLEHLTAEERIHFCNELYRVLKPGGKASIITPHWCSMRAYGDLTHQWPPVSEFFFYYLSEEWRKTNAPHLDLKCNFSCTWGYSLNPNLLSRHTDYQNFALGNFKEAAQDTISTWIKA